MRVSPWSSGYVARNKIEWPDNGNKFILHNIYDASRQPSYSWTRFADRLKGQELNFSEVIFPDNYF